MYLIDTNIFLEILLKQRKEKDCKKFLNDNIGYLNMSDFSLHSIGVILFKYEKENIFEKFIQDVLPNVNLLSLPADLYSKVVSVKRNFGLDFDDSYQYCLAKYFSLKIVTLDNDFKKTDDADIIFL